MLRNLKKHFPYLYQYYKHVVLKKKLREIKKLKKLSLVECAKIDEKLYKKKIGHCLDWGHLQTYTEKMQWEKLFNNNPQKSLLSDKLEVRKWVKEKIGEEYLIPLIGSWDNVDDIPFQKLPKQFVVKTTHGSGTNIIVKNKEKINYKIIKRQLKDWMEIDYGYYNGFEMHYSKITPRIIVEKYLETEYGELQDYKFLCFNGSAYFCWVDMGRYTHHTRNVYNLKWELQPWNQSTYEISKEEIKKPKNFDKMIEIAEILSCDFSHVRVDLYNINGIIYFGEMTFTNGGGLDAIIPTQYDLMLGKLWKINPEIPLELKNTQ